MRVSHCTGWISDQCEWGLMPVRLMFFTYLTVQSTVEVLFTNQRAAKTSATFTGFGVGGGGVLRQYNTIGLGFTPMEGMSQKRQGARAMVIPPPPHPHPQPWPCPRTWVRMQLCMGGGMSRRGLGVLSHFTWLGEVFYTLHTPPVLGVPFQAGRNAWVESREKKK